MWAEKYRPDKIEGLLGGKLLLESVKQYGWEKPLLISGGSGVGKTVLSHAIADELDFELVEVGDQNIGGIRGIVETGSVFGRKKLVLIEDVENISDIKKVTETLEYARNPMILTTSDIKSKRLATIKKKCETLQLRRPQAKTIAKYLKEICQKEGIEAGDDVLLTIAENSNGDVRSSVIDLETIAGGRKKITSCDLEVLYSRDRRGDIFKALSKIFGGKDFREVVECTWDLDEQPGDVIWWIDENMPKIYQSVDSVNDAYYFLSRADVFLGRITNRQYWGFLRYANPLMTAGVNASKDKVKYGMYQFPMFFAKLSRTKKEREMKKSIGKKLSGTLHVSVKKAYESYIPLFKVLIAKKRLNVGELKDFYGLDEEEVEYLANPVG